MTKVVAIVQARLRSTRLPGKVLMDLAGEPVLARALNRLARSEQLHEIVVATTVRGGDDAIEAFCIQHGWPCERGSEEDVLDRHYQAALAHDADAVVRITSDCPMIEPAIVDRVVKEFLAGRPEIDYASNVLPPRTFPRGLDTEVMRFDALQRAWSQATDAASREHVTPYIYGHPELFRLHAVRNDVDESDMRWSVDTPEDLELVRRVYQHIGHDRFSWTDALSLLRQRPDWMAINRHVRQKPVGGP